MIWHFSYHYTVIHTFQLLKSSVSYQKYKWVQEECVHFTKVPLLVPQIKNTIKERGQESSKPLGSWFSL